MVTFVRWVIAAGFSAAAMTIAVRLKRRRMLPSRRPEWWIGLMLCFLVVSYYAATALHDFDVDTRAGWMQGIWLFVLSHVIVILTRGDD